MPEAHKNTRRAKKQELTLTQSDLTRILERNMLATQQELSGQAAQYATTAIRIVAMSICDDLERLYPSEFRRAERDAFMLAAYCR